MRNLREACLALLLVAAPPALALEPQTIEAIVLRNRIFDGHGYRETLVPSQTDAFAILADAENVITYRQTLEYYWPLSRQFYAAFDKLDESLTGTLRILKDGATVAEVTEQPYVVTYPQGASRSGATLLWGESAKTALLEYQTEMRAYNVAVAAAREDRLRYERELKESAIARLKGGAVGEVAPPAATPEPVVRFVSDVATGYPVRLPVGTYSVAVVTDGHLVEGSTRRLDVIAAASGSAVTIDVVPEERWTRVLASTTPDDVLHASPGARFYVVLNRSDRFDEKEYRSLVEPQAQGQKGVDLWIRRGPALGTRLEVRRGAGTWTGLDLKDYKVRQTQGEQLGYVIEPARPGETGDISAYAVDVPAGSQRLALRVVDTSTGEVVPGTTRKILPVEAASNGLAWTLAAMPLLVGLVLLGVRRLKSRSAVPASEPGEVRAA